MVRFAFGPRREWTTLPIMAEALGVSRQRYWTWESKGRWPGREVLALRFARLDETRRQRVDTVSLAAWVETGPTNEPPFSPIAPAAELADLEANYNDGEAQIVKLDALVQELGRLAQERALDAATSGEKIPEKYQELVRIALQLMLLWILTKNQRPRNHRALPERIRPARPITVGLANRLLASA